MKREKIKVYTYTRVSTAILRRTESQNESVC